MTEELAFVAAMNVDPADGLPCLVFADWLEERGRMEHAEYLRNHVKLLTKPCSAFMYSCHESGFSVCVCSDYGEYDALRKRQRELGAKLPYEATFEKLNSGKLP